ncbi:hypothetical protein HD553DRAFT_104208 [Filobasidium floriforme]|uniref:uncharacterized protein n=1 Tax=Filobasidium floriforme TaxID=5210 RepID=UPI001E8EB4DE|nr:uncharacterized protein HD553DRAFT_104208 [Filobasidium floriforme]KAH8089824.1 hypothetical protein HD553DRAFT_104208 [Filobasidium floriforme]
MVYSNENSDLSRSRHPADIATSNIPYANHTERRDPETHKKLIGERIQRERPCRTLFVRNVSYEANTPEVLRSFEAFGEIKSHFDLVRNRGMVFLTYYDSRAAERAKDAMHSTLVMNRPIDVHYSLPRADETSGACDREKNQGTLLISLVNEREANPVQVRRMFSTFGTIKDLRPGQVRGTAYVEFFDSRAAVSAHDALQNEPLDGSRLRIKFEWDQGEDAKVDHAGPKNPGERRISGSLAGTNTANANYNRPAPYPDRPKPGDAKKADGSADRLQDARKIQDLLASLGSLPPSNNVSAPQAVPSASAPAPRASPFVPPNLPNYMGNRVNVPPALPQMRMPDQRSLPPRPPPVFNANAHQPSPQPPPAAPVISPSVFAALQQFNASGTASAPQQAGPSSIPSMPQTAFRPPNLPLLYPAQAPAPPTPSNTAGDTTQAMTQLLALLVAQQQK